MLVSCSNEESTTVTPPVAVDDNVTTFENSSIKVFVLQNDQLKNGAEITSFDETSVNSGTILERPDKSFIYTPPVNFVGIDTFTYTICDKYNTSNCATATVTIDVTDVGTPIAVDDTFEVIENTTVIINVIDNDTLLDEAQLNSIDTNSTNGTVVLNNDNTISYTATNGFSGQDTFTYLLCDNDQTPTCVTGIVTITVTDEGNPTAVNDSFNILENSTENAIDVLGNDTLIDDSIISTIDTASTNGTVILNGNGTITYTPQTNFTGEDSFTYTICDDDDDPNCSTSTVTLQVLTPINFIIPSELVDYYSDVVFLEDSDLMFEELENLTVTKHTTILSYGQRHNYLYNADADLSNTDNVILMYSGESRYWEEYTSPNNPYSPQTFNTEHIYPQSLLSSDGAVTDLHHLRCVADNVNGQRSNHPFIDGSGTYLLSNQQWFPGDEWKGDVARMVMYLNIRYGESFTRVGTLELFLKWNVEDPVSEFEEQRNNVIYGAQGNRNPFIDNPYLATLIWGGNAAENTWQ